MKKMIIAMLILSVASVVFCSVAANNHYRLYDSKASQGGGGGYPVDREDLELIMASFMQAPDDLPENGICVQEKSDFQERGTGAGTLNGTRFAPASG